MPFISWGHMFCFAMLKFKKIIQNIKLNWFRQEITFFLSFFKISPRFYLEFFDKRPLMEFFSGLMMCHFHGFSFSLSDIEFCYSENN